MEPELYYLEEDPQEQKNLAEELPEVTLLMEEKLEDWKKVHRPRYVTLAEKEEAISKETLEDLKVLGYVQ